MARDGGTLRPQGRAPGAAAPAGGRRRGSATGPGAGSGQRQGVSAPGVAARLPGPPVGGDPADGGLPGRGRQAPADLPQRLLAAAADRRVRAGRALAGADGRVEQGLRPGAAPDPPPSHRRPGGRCGAGRLSAAQAPAARSDGAPGPGRSGRGRAAVRQADPRLPGLCAGLAGVARRAGRLGRRAGPGRPSPRLDGVLAAHQAADRWADAPPT